MYPLDLIFRSLGDFQYNSITIIDYSEAIDNENTDLSLKITNKIKVKYIDKYFI